MAGRPPRTRHCLSWTAEGALHSAVSPELTREREVGGSALRSDQSPQPPDHIGPSQPGARPAGAAYSPELAGGPGPGRVSVPSFLREAVVPPSGSSRQGRGAALQGSRDGGVPGFGSPFPRPGSSRSSGHGTAWNPLEVPSRRLQIMH